MKRQFFLCRLKRSKFFNAGLFFITLFLFVGLQYLIQWQYDIGQPVVAQSENNLKVEKDFGKQPLFFIPNKGQTYQDVDFYLNSKQGQVFFQNGNSITVYQKSNSDNTVSASAEENNEIIIVTKNLVDANNSPKLLAGDKVSGELNYFMGNDPDKWIKNVEIYDSMIYENVYGGIDLKYRGAEDDILEYDFIVKPNIDFKQIETQYSDGVNLELSNEGDLIISSTGKYYVVYPHNIDAVLQLSVGQNLLDISSIIPSQNAVGVSKSSNIVIQFDTSLNPTTVNQANLSVWGSYTGLINGVYSVVGDTVTFNPNSDFKVGEKIQFSISTNIQSSGGSSLTSPSVSEFTVEVDGGTGIFGPVGRTDYDVGTNPRSVHAGDFNGDNKLDLAVANYLSNNVSILIGNGDGTFGLAVNYSVGTYPRSVYAGDFNGDNNLDLAVAIYNSNIVSILMGNGDGTFGVAVNYSVGSSPYSVNAGDFNGDNKLDLAVAK